MEEIFMEKVTEEKGLKKHYVGFIMRGWIGIWHLLASRINQPIHLFDRKQSSLIISKMAWDYEARQITSVVSISTFSQRGQLIKRTIIVFSRLYHGKPAYFGVVGKGMPKYSINFGSSECISITLVASCDMFTKHIFQKLSEMQQSF